VLRGSGLRRHLCQLQVALPGSRAPCGKTRWWWGTLGCAEKATQQNELRSLNSRPALPHLICGDKEDDEDDESYEIEFFSELSKLSKHSGLVKQIGVIADARIYALVGFANCQL
jgi:hypothetical protein